MIVYWFIFITSTFFTIFNRLSLFNNNYFKLFFYFLLLIFIGFRFEIGGDWNAYIVTFNEMNLDFIINYNYRGDIGYNLLQFLSKKLKLGIYGVNLFCALIFLIAINLICKLYKEYWLTFIILLPYLIFIVSTGYTRQSVSIAFATIGIYYLLADKNTYYQNYFYFLFFIFIGSLFHKSIIIMMIFLIPFINIYLVLLGFLILAVLFGHFVSFFENEVRRVVEQYLYTSYFSKGVILRFIILVPSILMYIFSLRYIHYTKNELKIFNIYVFLIIIFSFAVVFYPLAIIDRFALYFLPISALIYSKFTYIFKTKYIDYLIYKNVIIMYLFIQLYIWFNFSVHKSYWVPYKNILFNYL